MRLRTRFSEAALLRSRSAVVQLLAEIERHPDVAPDLAQWSARLEQARQRHPKQCDAYFDDLYVLDRCIEFLAAYGRVWRCIVRAQFSESWVALQDALDILRLIRRFSQVDIRFFESQLLELERAYPYNVFFSIGATVERFECSICGADIDSLACPHRKGHLYRGRMAQAIARNFVALDHVSMVIQPKDKRCVVSYDNDGPQFSVVRMIAELVTSGRMRIGRFERLEFSKRRFPTPGHRVMRRNEPCHCGSGLKFKRCCANKAFEERDHVDIMPVQLARDRSHGCDDCSSGCFRAEAGLHPTPDKSP